MSQSLYWEPANRRKKQVGGMDLREVFRDRPRLLGEGSRSFLEGLSAAKVEGAQELLDALDKHEAIQLYIE